MLVLSSAVAALNAACGNAPKEAIEASGAELNCAQVGCSCNAFYSIGFVQNVDGVKGNFEIAAPASAGGLVHYNREDDSFVQGGFDLPWSSPTPFASGDVNGVSLIQSSFTTNGKHHLEAVYVIADKLYAVWRNDGGGYGWSAPALIASDVRGTPAFIMLFVLAGGVPSKAQIIQLN